MDTTKNSLSKLPPPPTGQTGITLDQFAHLPPPPKNQQGLTLDQINTQPKQSLGPVGNQVFQGAATGIFNNSLTRGVSDFAQGATKSVIGGVKDLAGLLQSGGKALIGQSGNNDYGFKSLDSSTTQGQAINDVLAPDNTTQRIGGYAETAVELAFGAAGVYKLGRKGLIVLADKLTTGKLLTEEERLIKNTLEVINPQLTKTEKATALSQGRAETQGILKTTVIKPTSRQLEIADTVKDIVDPSNNVATNINNIRSEIANEATKVQTGLKNANVIVNPKEFGAYINQAKNESQVIFGNDSSLTNAYDSISSEMNRQLSRQPKTLGSHFFA